MKSRALLLLLCLLSVALAVPLRARAVDYNFAGTLQLDYLFTPFSPSDPRPSTHTLTGFTEELSLKVAADLSEHVSANAKVCFGCHGFEVGMGYADVRFADSLTLRFGRFSPSFGEFTLRHDPANHRLSDKPLPYDMGRMLRLTEFNRSVLPSPYVENGVELLGSHAIGDRVQLDWAIHAVTGMRAATDAPYDVDFTLQRSASPYYVDNNDVPSVGGRLAVNVRLAERADLTLGTSAMWGTYDTRARAQYLVLGADVYLRIARTNIRAEYLLRRTEMVVGDPSRFEYAIPLEGDVLPERIAQVRDGWYVEIEHPLLRNLDLVLRWDGLRRRGNVAPGSPLDFNAGISRWTLGANYVIERGYRLKASVEHYQYWGLRSGTTWDLAGHLGAVAAF
jgi:hypothetical protein